MTRAEQIAQIRADVERGKRLAAERFEATFGMPMTRENVGRVGLRAAQLAAQGRTSIGRDDI